MDLNALTTNSQGPSRWSVGGAVLCIAVAAGLLLFSLSKASAVTAPSPAFASTAVR